MSGDNQKSNPAVGVGIVFAIIGALAGSNAGGQGAFAGAVAGFGLGVAIVVVALAMVRAVIAVIMLGLAYIAFQGAIDRVRATTGVDTEAQTPTDPAPTPIIVATPTPAVAPTATPAAAGKLPIWFENECRHRIALYIRG